MDIKHQALCEVKQNLYCLAKHYADENNEDATLLFEAYFYLCDYINFVDKVESIAAEQRSKM